MNKEELRKQFESETKRDAVIINQYTYPTEQYFNWLEDGLVKLLTTPAVSKCVDMERMELLIAYTQKLLDHSYIYKGYKPETLVNKFIGN